MASKPGFSGFLGETFALIAEGAKGVLAFVSVIAGLNAALIALGLIKQDSQLGSFNFGFMIEPSDGLVSVLCQLVIVIVTIIGSYLLMAHLLEIRGRLPDRETRIWAYVGLSILSGLGMVAGAILLIIPGLILAVRWSAASGFLIGARESVVDSLSESWKATRGHSWPIFGAGVVLLLLLIVIAAVFGAIGRAMGSATMIAIFTSLGDAVGSAIFLAFGIAIYLLVSSSTDQLGEVFD